MYIALINYLSSGGMIKAGDEVPNPLKAHIEKGFVKEVKIIKQEIKDDAKVVKPKRRRTRKSNKSE
ncbi:hypothetical protein THIOSC15_1780006 [uncultured Thiomicrorhabdus sp.]